ncbi:MAG TPA: hypothetical protein VLC91_07280 [Spongiibacteraceae bacterium]|nr:hypothetical protein [Spongiibacteraceae bacterium]
MLKNFIIYLVCAALVTACTSSTRLQFTDPNLKGSSGGKTLHYRVKPDCKPIRDGKVVSEDAESVTFSSGENIKREDLCLIYKDELILNPFYYAFMALMSPLILVGAAATIRNCDGKLSCSE